MPNEAKPAATKATVAPQAEYVVFSAEINVNTAESLIALLAQKASRGVKEVHLLLSTPGGDVTNGVNLYNVLRAMPFKLVTHNVANVDSIGNAVFLAGDPRYACSNSTFMFHGVGLDVRNQRFEEKLLRESLARILREQDRIGDIIMERTRLTQEVIKGLFREAQTKDATFAIEHGIINEVRDVQIPAGAPVESLVFKR